MPVHLITPSDIFSVPESRLSNSFPTLYLYCNYKTAFVEITTTTTIIATTITVTTTTTTT
ncbi:hypothetical protein E2C01_063211 [Portunus trituberculatus]|uniref:Uncharacterized protein n=1 Tax=Portunus trituberculatus TaxID=210409 RepID=A0A5B7HJN7_PORTR|nr:hypothetical protein [Portunus trituberculatus]